ncbi:unnamed protein product [Timema podura]|uniref:protein-serine/threonine phosphatase n=1 Tax=Timema podura TaxID=61482 RepID=A0ABN7NLM9_TIMPD|nr:unnamed protein product [Timema podura]
MQAIRPAADQLVILPCLKFINKSHFEDVVEERAIISLCGYPLCGHSGVPWDLSNLVEAGLNSSGNQVRSRQETCQGQINNLGTGHGQFDGRPRVDDELCPCRNPNYCYAAAKFLAKQLLTSPLWIHDREEIPTFKLLPSTVYRNPAGEEVDFGVIRLDAGEKQRTTKPVDKAENPDIFEHSSNIAEIKEASDGYKNVTLSSTNILSHSAGYLNSSKTVSGEIEGVSSNLQIIENKVDFKNIIIPNKGIQDCDETLKDLSAHKVSAIESEPARGCENKPPISTPTPTHGKNTTLSQYSSPRNDRLQKTHTNKGVVQEPAMRSVVLRIETCLKEWFTVHTVKLLLGEDICQGLQQLNITEETGPVLPLVDLHAQNALRRRIVLDRLNRVLPEMLAALGLSDCDIATDVRELVGSFSLSAHNITFHPAEWNFLGLIIIHR